VDHKTFDAGDAESSLLKEKERDAWAQLRGALKEVFAESGAGEAYLHSERKKLFR